MKLFVIGAESKYAIERYYMEGFLKYLQPEDINFFPAQNMFYTYYNTSFLHKIFFRLGLSGIYDRINEKVLDNIAVFNPDVVFVFKGMEIYPNTLEKIKEKGIKLVNYNPDNPFIFSGKGSGNANITKSIALYDVHFTYSQTIKKEIECTYGIKTCILPFGFSIDEDLYASLSEIQEVKKVCFLGNPDKYRAQLISELANLGLKIDIYGHRWHTYLIHANVTIFPAVYEDEMWTVLRKYRVQLNYMRPHNLDAHNMRTFEIPAIGGIQVAPDTPDHNRYFENGKNIFLYKNVLECYNICNILLEKDTNEINKIRISARDTSILEKYSYLERASYAYNVVKQMF